MELKLTIILKQTENAFKMVAVCNCFVVRKLMDDVSDGRQHCCTIIIIHHWQCQKCLEMRVTETFSLNK